MTTNLAEKAVAQIPPEYLIAPEVAELCRVPVKTLYAWRMTGDGPPGARVGKRILFRRADVIAWLDGKIAAGGT